MVFMTSSGAFTTFVQSFFGTLSGIASTVAISIALFFLIMAGILWMTAAGNVRQLEKARTAGIGALVGLFIVIAANTILGLVYQALGTTAPLSLIAHLHLFL